MFAELANIHGLVFSHTGLPGFPESIQAWGGGNKMKNSEVIKSVQDAKHFRNWKYYTISECSVNILVPVAVQQLSTGWSSKETIVSSPRRLLSKDDFCSRKLFSKQTFFQGDSYIIYCPRKRVDDLTGL